MITKIRNFIKTDKKKKENIKREKKVNRGTDTRRVNTE